MKFNFRRYNPGMRPSVNDLLAREPFKSRAKQLLGEVGRCSLTL